MGEPGGQGADHRQTIRPLQVFLQLSAMLPVAQDKNATDKIAAAVLERRNREADRRLASPARHDITLSPRALLLWRLAFSDQFNQPRRPLEELSDRLL